MLRMNFYCGTALLSLLFFFSSFSSPGQSAPSNEILKWEQDMAVFDSLNLAEHSDANTLLVTGSSSVRLWDSIHRDLAPYQLMQRGYGGAKLTDYNYYAERIIKPHAFKAIVVFVANDIAGEESDLPPREVRRHFQDLMEQVRMRNPGTPVCWVEVTPTPRRWHVSQQIREASRLIEKYCNHHRDLHFINTYDYFLTPEGLPDSALFREDMLHLNRKGYLLWANIIKASLEEAGINP
ncbi:MAG: GDSL-type esterase/lipase family protein [Bacteroidales bacterium]|nr:GDSL-type esterase/lipase family protein [Bacteroidales bacterium]